MRETEVKVNLPEEELRGVHRGVMRVSTEEENGHIITKEYGFTVEEENKVLAFDLIEHENLGTVILFGNQVFVLKFWDDEDLEKGLRIITTAVSRELERRRNKSDDRLTAR